MAEFFFPHHLFSTIEKAIINPHVTTPCITGFWAHLVCFLGKKKHLSGPQICLFDERFEFWTWKQTPVDFKKIQVKNSQRFIRTVDGWNLANHRLDGAETL